MEKKDYAGRLGGKYRIILIILPVFCFSICLCLGRMMISPKAIFQSVLAKAGFAQPVSGQIDVVIWSMRIPRLILAAIAGIGLSVSGCTFQSLFSNPLATPDTLGVASGAGFGAALALLFGFGRMGVQFTALLFGMVAVVLTGVSGHGIRDSRSTPILAGIMVSSLFSSLVSLIKFVADTESQLPAITFWLMGSMESAGYDSLVMGAPAVIICTIVLSLLRWKMNLLPLSEDEAVSSGVNAGVLWGERNPAKSFPTCERYRSGLRWGNVGKRKGGY